MSEYDLSRIEKDGKISVRKCLDEIGRLHAEVERLTKALRHIARQQLVDEWEEPDSGDVGEGYEGIILAAREALGE